jgi:hypothetical protein
MLLLLSLLIATMIAIFISVKPPYNIILSILVFLAIILVVGYFLSDARTKPTPSIQAGILARIHLNRLSSIPRFSRLCISAAFPIYDLSGKVVTAYDVKITAESGDDRGYIVVNLNPSDLPILEFTTEGPSLLEQFHRKIGHYNFKMVWLTPTYSFALGYREQIITSIGDLNPRKPIMEKVKSKGGNQHYLHSLVWEERLKFRKRCKKIIAKAWKAMEEGRGGVGHVIENGGLYDKPTGNYYEEYVEGHDRTPLLMQIPGDTGVNTNGCPSGCGATAWTILLTHHNLLWAPELLRGSQDRNGQSWGIENTWECYIDRVTIQIAEKLQTYCENDTGWTDDSKMEKGFDYLKEDLGFDYTGRSEEFASYETLWNPDEDYVIEQVHKYILDHRRPVIVAIPSHFSVATGVLMEYVGNHIQADWVALNTGYGYMKYTPIWCLEAYWYFQDVGGPNMQDHLLPESGYGPVLLTTKGNGELYDKMWIFWLDSSKRINYRTGPPGSIPGTESPPSSLPPKVTLDATSIFPPAVTYDGRNIYLVYVDEANRIHLMWLSDKAKDFEEVDFPDLRTDVRPAITGGIGDWLTGQRGRRF